ncbi:MAG: endolytic transglycosylase MltG [Cucumibacter sp.]
MIEKSRREKKREGRKPNSILQFLNGLLMLAVLGIAIGVATVLFAMNRFYAEGPLIAETTFMVERGNGLSEVASRLADAGIIENSWIFRFGGVALKKQSEIKAGEFRIAARSSMAGVLDELTEGHPILHQVTIPEGFTSWQVVERLRAADTLSGEVEAVPAEGTLLPNTYAFQRGDDRLKIIESMAGEMQTALAEIWEGRDPELPIATPQDLVILASIVEKETGIAAERPLVAAVLVNRLNRGMRLQSDPTIIYGITGGKGPLGRGLRRSEIEGETPYNTYFITGLPAGPIANPGIDSLKAAANPAVSDALYFVADGTGGHAFAETYAEHRRNVAAWRAIEADRAEEAEAAALEAKDELEAREAESIGQDTSEPAAAPEAGDAAPASQ